MSRRTADEEAELRELEPGYCSQPTVPRCAECSLCNYGRDCQNQPVAGIE